MNGFIEMMTADTKFKPIPSVNRFGRSNAIFLMDSIPEITPPGENMASHKKYVVEEEMVLDFWNDISGFFHSNSHLGVCDYRETDWEIPSDTNIKVKGSIDSLYIPVSVGDRIVDSNYNVYKVVGFYNQNGSIDRYFNIK